MFSRLRRFLFPTSSSRLAVRSTAVFAVSSAAVFLVMYGLVAESVRERSDSWLIGESETLKEVALNTPRDALYNRIVGEVAELATQEVAYDSEGNRTTDNKVFFLQSDPEGDNPLWVGSWAGTGSLQFVTAVEQMNLKVRKPASVTIPGWGPPFRVTATESDETGRRVYLGLQDRSADALLRRMLFRFFLGWVAMVGFGFLTAYFGLRRMLKRVDQITTAAASIGSEDLSSRVSAGGERDEISRLARTFNNMLDRITASVSELRSVTESVAHDLKSPITSVRGSLEYALSTDKEEESRELVAKAIENLDRLSDVITTALDVAEADGGALRLRPERIDLTELLNRVAEVYAPAFAERRQTLEIDASRSCLAVADANLLTRVFSNLMENELRYAGEGAQVSIHVSEHNGKARVRVGDNGEGFAAELLPHIFERFVKSPKSEGHGLGLAFVKAVATAHGGTASAGNRSGGGAELVFEIPTRGPASTSSSSATQYAPSKA